MRVTTEQYRSDRRMMKAYIAARIPEEGIEVVFAEGADGEVLVELDPVRYGDGELNLHVETNCPEWAGIEEIYEKLRRQEMTVEKWGREIADKGVPQKVQGMKTITQMPEVHLPAKKRMLTTMEVVRKPAIDSVSVDDSGLPKEVSTAEAARILGVSKDTVLKLKTSGLLEYRIASPPGSCRPIFRFRLESVLILRTSYDADEPTPRLTKMSPRRCGVPQIKKYKHVKLED